MDQASVMVRPGEEGDLAGLTELYNYYILNTPITFDLEPYTVETRRPWFETFRKTGPHRILVATRDEKVLGYVSSGGFRSKRAYDTTIETSIYLAPEATGQGIGSQLYAALFDALKKEDLHRALAGATLPNDASIRLHERFGFKSVCTFSEVGRKFGKYWDVCWMEKTLG